MSEPAAIPDRPCAGGDTGCGGNPCECRLTDEQWDAMVKRGRADAPAIPAGVIPLSWAESSDERRNSRFEALSHIAPDQGDMWFVAPALVANEVRWIIDFSTAMPFPDAIEKLLARADGDHGAFLTADDAKAACEQLEIELGGAERAPRVPTEDPGATPPLVTDEHGFAPTRTIRSRWSRNEGVLYLFRVWTKPEDEAQSVEKKLEGAEYEAALPGYITQQMVQALVASITTPGGWIVPLTWNTHALGSVRLECEVHFVGVRALRWASPRVAASLTEEPVEIAPPSHALICSIVGEHLARKKAEFDAQLAGTTEDDLRRTIAKNARKLGIDSPLPEPEQESGFVLPATLEDMQRAGVDLRGASLR